MSVKNASEIKEKIISILKTRGPSLPVHISKEIGMSILFTSAFLSELLSEKKLKISNMKVGSSPVYFLPGQEKQLENFAAHLKSKEKDAFMLLKEKKFLKDSEQEPSIRVALRAIRDFAIPFKRGDEIFWRYFSVPEEEFAMQEQKPLQQKQPTVSTEKTASSQTTLQSSSQPSQKSLHSLQTSKKPSKKTSSKKASKKTKKSNEKFFNKIKEFLLSKSITIQDIESFNKNEIVLKVKHLNEESILVAYNKKRLTDTDIIKAYKKAAGKNFSVFSLGETPKKLKELIEALSSLSEIGKIG